jgi:enoyl-CoA hydratase/carnithine racemase
MPENRRPTMSKPVLLDRRDTVAVITLNRPEVLNAVDDALRTALVQALKNAGADPTVRAVVITGAGNRAFCAGQDLVEAARYTSDDLDAWLERQHAMYAAARDLDKPCIAAFNGVAAGAGFQLGLVADLRVGYPEMRLGQPEIRAGLASIVGTYLMTLHLPESLNRELSLTGALMTGERAFQVGLLNRLVPQSEVLETAVALAQEMSALGATSVALTKQRLRALSQAGFDDALQAAKRAQRAAYASGEPQAAMQRFLTRRPADGR